MWQHKSQKVGKFLIQWNTGLQEYATVKPVLRDLPEETLRFVWRVYGKTPSVVAYVGRVTQANYKGKIVVEGFTSLRKYTKKGGGRKMRQRNSSRN